MLFIKILLVAAPVVLVALSFLPKVLIEKRDRRLDAEAIDAFQDTLVIQREPTFEERWDAADDAFMKEWSSFCSRDLETENQSLLLRFAAEAEEVIQRHVENVRWTYDHMACYFLGVDTTVELTASYLVMKADGVDFDALRERVDPLTDTQVWTSEMETELTALLVAGALEEVKS